MYADEGGAPLRAVSGCSKTRWRDAWLACFEKPGSFSLDDDRMSTASTTEHPEERQGDRIPDGFFRLRSIGLDYNAFSQGDSANQSKAMKLNFVSG